ncbi:uncharacterized protein LOC142979770 [Anticarsia gemmatalis]|uniref:uncharacterized protein LOC142979770 n=1 Tax=Anticarsia gemmatalis TaxID=129554 RepID=UPI003F75D244
MWAQVMAILSLTSLVLGDQSPPGFHRTMSDGVKSISQKVVYGDEDMTIINEVVSDVEKKEAIKKLINPNEVIVPLPAQDVKCLMSVDRYCTREMGVMKSILIKAVKEDCKTCSTDEKEKAGKVIASMMTHDPVAWKLFLTRSALQVKKPTEAPKRQQVKFVELGEPVEVVRSPKNRFAMPGVKVRVKRYGSVLVP